MSEKKKTTASAGQRFKNLISYSPKSKLDFWIRVILNLIVPYAYLMLCGLVFDRWLHLYNMTTFIFFSYVALQLAGIVAAVFTIRNNSKSRKKHK